MEFSYKALQIRQTQTNKPLILFSAKATEIERWAGVPQKKRFGTGEETAGFQREENVARIKSLSEFYSNEDNIIQNPLLCATRSVPFAQSTFYPADGFDITETECHGIVTISIPDFSQMDFKEIFGYVRNYIESRVPDLAGMPPNDALISRLKTRATESGEILESDLLDEEGSAEEIEQEDDEAESSSVLFQESHIVDFWQEVAARHEILKQLQVPIQEETFIGFSREAMLSYLRPIVLVDGQHRLRGALRAAREHVEDKRLEEIEERIFAGESEDEVDYDIMTREARRLPVSLLVCDDPAEQVFQFVVVNQKAVPMGRALLGTIVSTTLSNDEMGNVATRLKNAGVELEESQAITFLIRHPGSPFYDLVERGMAGDSKHLLQWNVFGSLVSIFRELKGGKLFGEPFNDYAELWRNRHLEECNIVGDFESYGCQDGYARWRMLDGPWRDIFIQFWSSVRDKLGNFDDPDRPNYWGRPRGSNLFNKVSLTILTADFFQFLVENKSAIHSPEAVRELVSQWLEYVNPGYFDKDWDLGGVKKDSSGIRSQWASLWTAYRKRGGKLPDRRLFRNAKKD